MREGFTPRDFEGRRVYGFVEAIEPPIPGNNFSLFALMLDAVDADAFDDAAALSRQPEYLSIIRVISTPQRMRDLFGLEIPPEGKWMQLTLGHQPGWPRAWVLSANNDFLGTVVRTNVIGASNLGAAHDAGALQPLVAKLAHWCTVESQNLSAKQLELFGPRGASPHIRMLDVGHASCAAIHTRRDENSPIIGYFDAGAPAFFHSRSFPRFFYEATRVPSSGFVALSHWDFDHYALAVTRLKTLQQLDWYAPRQDVGPNAARFQDALGPRLHYLEKSVVRIARGLSLHRGLGAASDRNNSGYVMHLGQKGRRVLLTADVSYDHIKSGLKNELTAMSVPHHGGNGSAFPPAGRGIAAVSYGVPNRYRHPVENNLTAHCSSGWKVERTAAHGVLSRGDRWLT